MAAKLLGGGLAASPGAERGRLERARDAQVEIASLAAPSHLFASEDFLIAVGARFRDGLDDIGPVVRLQRM